MLNRVSIRSATDADAEICQRYVANLFAERLPVLYRQDGIPTVEDQRTLIRNIEDAPRSIALLALASGEIIGMLDFHGYPEPQRSHAGTFGMSVSADARGKGVGRLLLEALFDWASRNHIRRIELETFSNNGPAIRFYERSGFVVEGRKKQSIEVDGELLDIVLMAKLSQT